MPYESGLPRTTSLYTRVQSLKTPLVRRRFSPGFPTLPRIRSTSLVCLCLSHALVLVQVLVRGRDPPPGRRRFRPGQPLTRLIRHLQYIPKQVQGIHRSDLGLAKSAWESRPPQLVHQLDSTPHPGVYDFIARLGGLGWINK